MHLTHWGAFEATSDGHTLTSVRPWRGDPDPYRLIDNVASAQHHPTRIDRPYARRGWLERGPGGEGRGADTFVPVTWDEALDAVSGELRRVYTEHGPRAVYGGSYGWSSAGRFHHAQSQLHRFLNSAGGYVRHFGSYSHGASKALLPHVIGELDDITQYATSWPVIAEHSDMVVAFGGISGKNAAMSPGGVGRHPTRHALAAARARGCRFVSVGPLRDDTPAEAEPEWLAPRPGTDAALMLGLAHVLMDDGLADTAYLDRYTVGYPAFAAYLRGEPDGAAKTPEWAEAITGVPAATIRGLARDMASGRTLITVSWSLQRTRFGEQPLWLGVVLAAMLGQIGLPGGGFGHGYGSTADVGMTARLVSPPSLPQGTGIDAFIPVARVADMLLHPGEAYDFNGRRMTYPDIRLVYWAGGNPFHHHQDLGRLHEAFTRPDTVVVHEQFWTATARHADIVLPATMSIERDDFGAGKAEGLLFPMPALTRPAGEARDDYAIFTGLAARLGVRDAFTEGRDVRGWLRHLYDEWRDRVGGALPDFDTFWAGDPVALPMAQGEQVLLGDFRTDPDAFPLDTPSGRIEVFSETIAGFGYDDCPGHPSWLEPEEWLGAAAAARYPLHLIANQPRARLHSQLDIGEHSRKSKIAGREPVRLHPDDAAARGLHDGDPVRIFNDRGSCLAGLETSTAVRPGVVQLSTGAWYDPDPADPRHCRHGNPNVLTADRPTSRLGQACTGQHALVEVEPHHGPLPDLTVDGPPGM
ncbi:MAG TPA: molybdopterin-dependent oxidoreductase [Streptosporangiaceae bacterium]